MDAMILDASDSGLFHGQPTRQLHPTRALQVLSAARRQGGYYSVTAIHKRTGARIKTFRRLSVRGALRVVNVIVRKGYRPDMQWQSLRLDTHASNN